MNLVDKYAAELVSVSAAIWADVSQLSRQQLDDLKHEAGDRKQTDPSPHARLAAQLVETVCDVEIEARRK